MKHLTWDIAHRLIAENTQEISSAEITENPLVSVCFITYNHQRYVQEALESVICQKTNFLFEIVIGDDCSTDDTTEIVLEYQKKYPQLIRVLLAKKNLGKYTGNGRLNGIRIREACRGKYIALLEGDDYWTDETKLQQQVDILEQDQECTGVFHDTQILNNFTVEIISSYPIFIEKDSNKKYTLDDLIYISAPFATSSFLYRSSSFDYENLTDDILKYLFLDLPLFLTVASYGYLRYISKTMSVYRKHLNSITFSQEFKQGKKELNKLFIFNSLRKELYPKGDKKFGQVIIDLEQRIINFFSYLEKTNSSLQTEIRNLRNQKNLALQEGNYTLAVAHVNPNAYSETFIHNHLKYLPAEIINIPGISFPLQQNREQLKQFLLEKQVDAILAEYGRVGVALMDICQELSIPLIVHFHGFDAYSHGELQNSGRYYPSLFQKSSATIAVSRHMEQQLLSLGAVKEKLYYNPYGVNLSLFQPSQPEKSELIFIAVGRFIDKKAPNLTILAFAQVCYQYPQVKLIMIGEGVLLESCKMLAKSLGIEENIEFTGSLPQSAVAEKMRQARAFVQHSVTASYGDSEGTPNSVIEASASGIPIIATRHAGIKDVVIEGETGFLVDEGDVDGMAEYMIQLAENSELAQKLGEAGRKRIEQYFSLEQSLNNLWTIIKDSIEKNKAQQLTQKLDLSETNLIVFPDWSMSEEEIGEDLLEIISQLMEKPPEKPITLLIDTTGILPEDATELFSAISMSLLFEYELDLTEYINISLLGDLTEQEWQILTPLITKKLKINHENQTLIKELNIK